MGSSLAIYVTKAPSGKAELRRVPWREVVVRKGLGATGMTSLTLVSWHQESMHGLYGHRRGVVQCRRNMVWDRRSAVIGGTGILRAHGMVQCTCHGVVQESRMKSQESEIHSYH